MANGTVKTVAVLVVCFILVSQSALAWSLWEWFGVKSAKKTPQPQAEQYKSAPAPIQSCATPIEETAYYKKLSSSFQQQTRAWQKEYELAMNYARSLEKDSSEKEKLYNLCKSYIYPECPPNAVNLKLMCSGSMLPEIHCKYGDIWAFSPTQQRYAPQVCDVISFDIPNPVNVKDTDGKNIEISRLIHRVIDIKNFGYLTKGDAVEKADEFSPKLSDIKWVVCKRRN